eukprot:1700678-Rhodomonas_salina.3
MKEDLAAQHIAWHEYCTSSQASGQVITYYSLRLSPCPSEQTLPCPLLPEIRMTDTRHQSRQSRRRDTSPLPASPALLQFNVSRSVLPDVLCPKRDSTLLAIVSKIRSGGRNLAGIAGSIAARHGEFVPLIRTGWRTWVLRARASATPGASQPALTDFVTVMACQWNPRGRVPGTRVLPP